MTRGELFFVLGILAFEVATFFLCFQWPRLRGLQSRKVFPWVFFVSIHLMCLFLILLGGYAERRINFYDNLYGALLDRDKFSGEMNFEIYGDPDLWLQVRDQQPILQRPDMTNASELGKWQKSLRQILIDDVFELQQFDAEMVNSIDEISSTTIEENIKRTFLTFESFDGTSIPAYLFTPESQGPKPAIIVLSGHVPEGHSGLWQVAGLVDSYQHKVALRLAKAGFVTFAIEFRGFGMMGAPLNTEHTLIAYNAILAGSFYKAILVKDIHYAFGVLESLKEDIDSQRIGITGISYGGEMAVTYAALDSRVKSIVSQGYGGQLGVYTGVKGTRKDQPHFCQIIPGFNNHLLRQDLLFLVAPRPFLGVRGSDEASVDPRYSKTVEQVYRTLNADTHFKFEIQAGGHEYFVEPAIQFFKANL